MQRSVQRILKQHDDIYTKQVFTYIHTQVHWQCYGFLLFKRWHSKVTAFFDIFNIPTTSPTPPLPPKVSMLAFKEPSNNSSVSTEHTACCSAGILALSHLIPTKMGERKRSPCFFELKITFLCDQINHFLGSSLVQKPQTLSCACLNEGSKNGQHCVRHVWFGTLDIWSKFCIDVLVVWSGKLNLLFFFPLAFWAVTPQIYDKNTNKKTGKTC